MRLLPLAAAAVLLAACGSYTGAATGAPRGSGNVIEADEIRALDNARNAYDIIRSLRPQFLRAQRSTRAGGTVEPIVYVDGSRMGDVSNLREIPYDAVTRIEFLRASDATTRFGTGHTGGALLVSTERSRRGP